MPRLNPLAGRGGKRRSLRGKPRRNRTLRVEQLEDRSLLAAFTPGNLVVYRVGDLAPNNADLQASGSPVFLDEFTPDGTLVQSIPLPQVADGMNRPLVANGRRAEEGALTLSVDGRYLFLTGYDRALPATVSSALNSTNPSTVNRTIGRVDWLGNVETIMGLSDVEKGIHTIASYDGSELWIAGESGSVQRSMYGYSNSTFIIGPTSSYVGRQLHIFNDQLYLSTSTRIAKVGEGLPTGAAALSGPVELNLANAYGFYFADLNPAVAGLDTLYVASDSSLGLSKYTLYDGVWTLTGAVGGANDRFRGLTASVTGTTVTLYAVAGGGTGASGGGKLVKLVDSSGYNGELTGTPVELATAANQTAFRGVAFAPHADNNAPVYNVAGNPTLGSVAQNAVNNPGIRVVDLIASGGGDPITDLDPGALEGIAIVAADTTAGEWEYSLDDGESWNPLGLVSLTSARLLAADSSTRIRLVPHGTFVGELPDALRFRAWDQTAGTNGGLLDPTGRVGADGAFSILTESASIEVLAYVNTPPDLSAIDDQTIDEDASLLLEFVVGDDSGPENLVVTATSSNPVLLPETSIVLGGSGANRTALLTPVANAFGTVTITITVSDGELTRSEQFELLVRSVNDPPTIAPIEDQATDEDVALPPIALELGDIDELAQLAVEVSSDNPTLFPPANLVLGGSGMTRTLTVTPAPNQHGVATIRVVVTDSSGATAERSFVVTVAAVNDPPTLSTFEDVAIDEDEAAEIPFAIGDPETPADALQLALASNNPLLLPPESLVLEGVGEQRILRIAPAANQSGVAIITITLADESGGQVERTFQVTVNPVNDPPTLSAVDDLSLRANQVAGPITVALDDIDHPAAALTLAVQSSNLDLIPLDRIVVTGDGDLRTLVIAPVKNVAGTAIVTLTVIDPDGLQSSTTFAVTVAENESPTLTSIADQSLLEDSQLGDITFVIGDLETSLDGLTVSVSSDNPTLLPAGSLIVSGQGGERSLTVAPAENQFGEAIVTVTVTDENGSTVSRSFRVEVAAVNDAPIAFPSSLVVPPNQLQSATLEADDVDGPTLTFELATLPSKGIVSITNPATGEYIYRPYPGERGYDRFSFRVRDGQAESELATVSVYVEPYRPTITFEAGVLTIVGTPYDDFIAVVPLDESSVVAVVGIERFGPFPTPEQIRLCGEAGRDALLVYGLSVPVERDYGEEPDFEQIGASSVPSLASPIQSAADGEAEGEGGGENDVFFPWFTHPLDRLASDDGEGESSELSAESAELPAGWLPDLALLQIVRQLQPIFPGRSPWGSDADPLAGEFADEEPPPPTLDLFSLQPPRLR